MRNPYKTFSGEPEGRLRWEDNTRKYLKETEQEDAEGIYLAQDRDH
jgi:hypothetical protein